MAPIRPLLRALLRRLAGRRGNVAMLGALIFPAMAGATGLGIEVSYWALHQATLQRIADAAALAAASEAQAGAATQAAANAGADVAELNGLKGAFTRSWDGTSNVLTDNQVIVKKIAGIKYAGNNAFQAVATQGVPLVVAKLFSSLSSVPISATGSAEVVTTVVQACVIALGPGQDITIENNAGIDQNGCSTLSNGSVFLKNNGFITNTGGVRAAGSVTLSNGSSIAGPIMQNGGTFSDPLANNAAIQAAETTAASASGSTVTKGGTINPGSYSGFDLPNNAVLNLNPGTYYINGDIKTKNGVTINGTGVTLVMTGTVTFGNNAIINIVAPNAGATSGIPGMSFIGTSSNTLTINNNANLIATGVIYYPKGTINAQNNFGKAGNTCMVVVTYNLDVAQNGYFSNACPASQGVPDLGVHIGNPTVTLVQ
jgi:Flp pilus assembly protein TadG